MHKFCISRVLGNFFGFECSVNAYAAARERHHLQLVLFEQVPQFCRAAKFLDDIGAQLYSVEAQRRNICDRLPVVSAPGDGRVSKMDLTGPRRNRRIKIRQVHRRIKRLSSPYFLVWKRGNRRNSRYSHAQNKFSPRHSILHTTLPDGLRNSQFFTFVVVFVARCRLRRLRLSRPLYPAAKSREEGQRGFDFSKTFIPRARLKSQLRSELH